MHFTEVKAHEHTHKALARPGKVQISTLTSKRVVEFQCPATKLT